jgi:hypothetical protein
MLPVLYICEARPAYPFIVGRPPIRQNASPTEGYWLQIICVVCIDNVVHGHAENDTVLVAVSHSQAGRHIEWLQAYICSIYWP